MVTAYHHSRNVEIGSADQDLLKVLFSAFNESATSYAELSIFR
jgi:hypothetical protein